MATTGEGAGVSGPGKDDERQLAHWVAHVTARWAAHRSLSIARRKVLFARLLTALAQARTTGGITTLTSTDPTSYADTNAQEPPRNTSP